MGLYQITVRGVFVTGATWQFGIWYQSAGPLSSVLTAGETWVDNFWGTTAGTRYGDYVSEDMGITTLRAAEFDLASGKQLAAVEEPYEQSGRSLEPPLPHQVALGVSLRTARTGAGYRGRLFLPSPTWEVLDAYGLAQGPFCANVVTALQSAWGGASAIGTAVLYRRLAAAVEPLTSIDIPSVWVTRRSRSTDLVGSRTAGDL